VRSEILPFLALVALPLVVVVCLGLSVRTLVGRGSQWWLWLWAAVVLGVFWYVYLLGVR
jgi:hypothetical protein